MNRKFLLTGATGFVGRQVLRNLLKNQIAVRAIVRKNKEIFFKDQNPKIELITTNDLFKESVDWWAEQCKGIDTIIHVAWYAEPQKYLQSIKNIDCLKGSLNLAKGAIKSGIRRFVAIGTCFEYDLSAGDLSINTPLKPLTLYSKSKVRLYTLLSRLLPAKSIEFSWCRLFYLYGEGEDERKLVAYLHKKLSKNQIVELTSGKQIRDFLDVSEAGRMIVDLAISKQQGPINICSGIPVTIRQLAEKIADEYGCRDLLKFGAKPDNLIDPPRIVGLPNIISL
jgi:dTDP-6-deoxy-L-talose 4-dehydrogenase (NAD+)